MKQSAHWRESLLGKALDPFSGEARKHVALVAFIAWVGLGADGLSSACYGPEEAFLALGTHTPLSLYLAAMTAVTVFVIAVAYNQVIELFPNGGGGYKVASSLLGSHAGLVSGSALIVDYVLTISISVASGVDALFSLLPPAFGGAKLGLEVLLTLLLLYLNLRGMKESIKFLLPIFIGFVLTHTVLILYGVFAHGDRLPGMVAETVNQTQQMRSDLGWVAVAALLLRAYSLGGGTYTGIEAVSNNVQSLVEPRVRTGKWTMFYMALSLAFTAGGIIVLYLLWDAQHVDGRTLNAVTFEAIIGSFGWQTAWLNAGTLIVVLAFEAGLLLVAANTGFLGGPAVLANMAVDSWMPHQFRNLSSRLVTQNGVILMAIAAVAVLLITTGNVSVLVVLYSINVFLTFSLSLAGLIRYWLRHREDVRWKIRLALSLTGFVVCAGILVGDDRREIHRGRMDHTHHHRPRHRDGTRDSTPLRWNGRQCKSSRSAVRSADRSFCRAAAARSGARNCRVHHRTQSQRFGPRIAYRPANVAGILQEHAHRERPARRRTQLWWRPNLRSTAG